MYKIKKPPWDWQCLTPEEIFANLSEAKKLNIDYRDLAESIMGFPGTTPHQAAVDAFKMFIDTHANNICTHTSGESEDGFKGTQEIEREVIFMLANMLGVKQPTGYVDGYLTPGGTEANIMGLYLGREYLRGLNSSEKIDIAIITSFFSHYSIRKAAVILDMEDDSWNKCQNCKTNHLFKPRNDRAGLQFVGTDTAGRIDINQLTNKVKGLYQQGTKNFIIVLTEGTTLTGAVDRTHLISLELKKLKKDLKDVNFFIHIDACFGGFVVPFLDFKDPTALGVPKVDSIAIDPHKMGLAPYPAGAFIYRRDKRQFKNYLGVMMGYVPGHSDATLCGSRSGASAAACYAVLKTLGKEGYQKLAQERMHIKEYLIEKISQLSEIEIIPHDINILGFRTRGKELSKRFTKRHKIHNGEFPVDFKDPKDCVKKIYVLVMMHHVTKAMVDNFIIDLKKEIA